MYCHYGVLQFFDLVLSLDALLDDLKIVDFFSFSNKVVRTVRLVKTVLNCYKLTGNESNPESNKLNYPL